MEIRSWKSRFSGYFRTILYLVLGTMAVFMLVDFVKVRTVRTSLRGYMEDVRDLTFMSTYDSLKKGNMKTFTSHLKEVGTFEDVEEFSLLNQKGEVRYSSDERLKGSVDPQVAGLVGQAEIESGSNVIYYFPVLTSGYCTRCHPTWSEGSINSYYRLTLSRSALQNVDTLSVYYYIFIAVGGLVFMTLIYMLFDVVERRREEDQLLLTASVFDNTIEGIIITDSMGVMQKVNQAFSDITGLAPEEALGRNIRLLNAGEVNRETYLRMRRQLRESGQWSGEIWNRRTSGESYPVKLSVNAVRNRQGELTHYVSIFHDISEIQQSRERLEHQVSHDALTGLPNRSLFIDRLEMALGFARRHGQMVAVMFLDLDNFKLVNDSAGHHVGDLFLKDAAQRIQRCCREGDTVARFGGDEFVLILPDVKQAEEISKVCLRIQDVLRQPVTLDGHEVYSGASVGVSVFPDDGDDPNVLIRNADMAMYRAKEKGKNQHVFFTEGMNARFRRRVELEKGMRQGLERVEFELYYQPKVDMRSGRLVGVEALLRWRRDTNELVLPGEFIPFAEESGLIVPLGNWVMGEACRQAQAWREAGLGNICMGINLSARQLLQEDLFEQIQETLKRTGMASPQLNLEITESAVVADMERAKEVLGRIARRRIKTSLDDFGTGYGALSYLKAFNFDFLKIDRSFVRDLMRSGEDRALVKTVLLLARELQLEVVAEGVETREQLEFLWMHGCHRFQGYLFSPPLPAAELEALLCENIDWRERFPLPATS